MTTTRTPNSQALEPDVILSAMHADLVPWASKLGGEAFIGKDPVHVFSLLAETPAGFRAVIHFDRDTVETPDMPAPMSKQAVKVLVSTNVGLSIDPGSVLTKTNAAQRASLLSLLSNARKRVLSWRFPESVIHKGRLYYDGFEPIEMPQGYPLAAYELNFHYRAAVPVEPETGALIQITLP